MSNTPLKEIPVYKSLEGASKADNYAAKAVVGRLHMKGSASGKIHRGAGVYSTHRVNLGRKIKIVTRNVQRFINEAFHSQNRSLKVVISRDNEHSITITLKPESEITKGQVQDINPFADEAGGPQKGKELEFFTWEENKWLKFVNSLPEKEKQEHLDAAKSLAEKMDH